MSKSFSKTFVKDNATVIVGQLLIYMTGILLMPIIIKGMGVAIYGGFVLFSSLLGIVFGISSFGVGFRTQRFLPSANDRTSRQKLFYPQFYFHMFSVLCLSLLLIVLSGQINAAIFKNSVRYSAAVIPVFLLCYFLYSQCSAYFRYTSRVNYMIATSVFYACLYIGFVSLALTHYRVIDINSIVLSQSLSAFLVATVSFLIIFRELGVDFIVYRLGDLLSDIKIGFPIVLNILVDFILVSSDRYFIAYYLNVSAVGQYNPGYLLGSLMIFVPKTMGTVLPQLLSKAVDQNKEYEAERMLNYSLKLYLLLAIPFIFGSLVLAKPLLGLLANREVAENAYLVVPIVGLGSLFYGVNIILSNVLFVRMRTDAMFKMTFVASLFNLAANFILLYFFRNILVAAVTTVLSYGIAFVYVNRIVLQCWRADFQMGTAAKAVLASLVMTAVLFAVSVLLNGRVSRISLLIGELILGVVVYFSALLFLKAFSEKELLFVKRFIRG